MSIRVLELGAANASDVVAALRDTGAVFVRDGVTPPTRFAQALRDAAELFALPRSELSAIDIARSPHFRGYSEMVNARDWRSQLHLGRDEVPGPTSSGYGQLRGPNQWPTLPGWRQRAVEWLDRTEAAGRRVLAEVAAAYGAISSDVSETPDGPQWLGPDPYRIAKLIAYHPQARGSAPRPGVAAHLDFSLLTLTIQDEVGGLQVRDRDGSWEHVAPVAGAWLVHVGELLGYVTGGEIAPTPHRVVNPSIERRRYSMPYFLCPSLDITLTRTRTIAAGREVADDSESAEHVHAVLDPRNLPDSIAFGPAEWRRKGENFWCHTCCSPRRPTSSRSPRDRHESPAGQSSPPGPGVA